MSLIRLKAVSVAFEKQQVLREVHFRLLAGERVGLIGKNGSGKSTFIKLILGQIEPSAGTVERDQDVKIGYFSQFSELQGSASALDSCNEVFAEVCAAEAELERINEALADVTETSEQTILLARQAELFELMDRKDGWTVGNQIDTVLTRLGFAEHHRVCPVDELSGGWRNRAALARILLEAPDVLLLDEPTNYLDVEGVTWLENWVREFRGAALVVSHDREFLNQVVTRIVELENYHIHEYPGNFGEYVRLKGLKFKQLERQFEHEESLLACEAEDIADLREAKRNPGGSLAKRLARIHKQVTPRPVDTIITDIYNLLKVPERIVTIENLAKGYGDRSLFEGVDLEILRGQRLAVVGPNGCGKSTFVRVLVGEEKSDAGQAKTHTSVAYYNEFLDDLDPGEQVWRAVNAAKFVRVFPNKKVQRFLSLLRFSEADFSKEIGLLSGGEKARVALGQCLLSGAGLIVLDEPTNHLDITAAQVMERALVHFPGAVVVVSHDRLFVDKVATHRLIFDREAPLRMEANLQLP